LRGRNKQVARLDARGVCVGVDSSVGDSTPYALLHPPDLGRYLFRQRFEHLVDLGGGAGFAE